jgi:hypothetical protein
MAAQVEEVAKKEMVIFSFGADRKGLIKFEEPVTIAEKKVTELECREPQMRDIRIAANAANPALDPVTYEMTLIGNLVGLGIDEMDALAPSVYKKIKGVLAPFLS